MKIFFPRQSFHLTLWRRENTSENDVSAQSSSQSWYYEILITAVIGYIINLIPG
jgi:hypothetical protein